LLTPASINLAVRTGDVVMLLRENAAGTIWRVAAHYQADGLLIATQDSRTNTTDIALTVRSTTSGTPAAGIGVGMDFQAESADESPSDFGRIEVVASDVAAGTEDTYWQLWTRVAGAALAAVYRFVATGAFKAIFTHANTADRTYTLPNRSIVIDAGAGYMGPSSIGSGSTRTLETFSSATGNLSGVHYYNGDVTLNSGHTLTVPAGKRHLVIYATGTITINGTITAAGAGAATQSTANTNGNDGTAASGGGGDGGLGGPGNGGNQVFNGITLAAGGTCGQNGVGFATAGAQATGSDLGILLAPLWCTGGASGGCGGGGTGGAGGGSIVLIAPSVVLANTATLNTSGSAGTGAAGAAGGGGGAGNVYIITTSYTDNGCTFTQTGGAGAGVGKEGGNGIKQINIHA